jgi:glycosyltransferase involved in cell wall biosynthesis
MWDQSVAFAAFARRASRAVAEARYDVVFATSSRLMTGVLGAMIARRMKAKFYLDLRDIFAETMPQILPSVAAPIARPILSRCQAFAVHRANRVNLVSPGFMDYFKARYPRGSFVCIPNGVDQEFLEAAPTGISTSPRPAGPNTLSVVYAGNVGDGQGLHLIVPQLARTLGSRVHFKIIGDGGRRSALQRHLSGTPNVEFVPPVSRSALIQAYRAADILFLHLNDYPALRRVLPSKLFEYAAMGKPIWAGVSGYAAEFVKSEITNAVVFPPCDQDGAIRALEELTLEDRPRLTFATKFARSALIGELSRDVLSLASPQPPASAGS